MMTIRRSATLHAKPQEVFETLMDSRKHAKLTNGKANISRKIGGKYVVMDGWIMGENLDIKKNQIIKQTWRGKHWSDSEMSKVKFNIKRVKGGSKIQVTHRLPDKYYNECKKGWKESYIVPLKNMFNAGS